MNDSSSSSGTTATSAVEACVFTPSSVLGRVGPDKRYPCIQDLLEHGLDVSRFATGEIHPNHHDVTQYMAAWSRHAGLSHEQSAHWLNAYCGTTIATLTNKSQAVIRHRVKSNLRYVYGSQAQFACQCENNRFRAHCGKECPAYETMQALLQAKALEDLKPKPLPQRPPPPAPFVSVKQRYLEQFNKALALAQEEHEKGAKLRDIVNRLDEMGLKTKTGRTWTIGLLSTALSARGIRKSPRKTTPKPQDPLRVAED